MPSFSKLTSSGQDTNHNGISEQSETAKLADAERRINLTEVQGIEASRSIRKSISLSRKSRRRKALARWTLGLGRLPCRRALIQYQSSSTSPDRQPRAAWIAWSVVASIALLLTMLVVAAPLAADRLPGFRLHDQQRPSVTLCHQIPERSFHLAGHPLRRLFSLHRVVRRLRVRDARVASGALAETNRHAARHLASVVSACPLADRFRPDVLRRSGRTITSRA